MRTLPKTHNPPLALGPASLVLGTIGLALFFLPILGIPISSLGLLLGLAGLVTAGGAGVRLRWSLAGVAVCCLGLLAGWAVGLAPAGYVPARAVPANVRPSSPGRPYVAPPSLPLR